VVTVIEPKKTTTQIEPPKVVESRTKSPKKVTAVTPKPIEKPSLEKSSETVTHKYPETATKKSTETAKPVEVTKKSTEKAKPVEKRSLEKPSETVTHKSTETVTHKPSETVKPTEETVTCKDPLSLSPLFLFRSFRLNPVFKTKYNMEVTSTTFSHKIDPENILCRYELHGICNDEECKWMHKRDYTLTGKS
jgi:outer membrane biosynthesis protein TonB